MKATTIKQQIQSLIKELSYGLLEREHEIALALLCALSGENLFMIGPPGVGKSLIAGRIKLAFKEATFFNYLLSRFSTPDELFGPVSIAKLKEEDKYCRNVEGYLPTASVVFLDEIWKASPSILNTLLTVMNERIYRNGTAILPIQMKLLVAASNELPNAEEGLDALWDRFLMRLSFSPVSEKSFFQLLTLNNAASPTTCKHSITDTQYTNIQKTAKQVELPQSVLEGMLRIREALEELSEKQQVAPLYISDRRWLQIVRLLKTSAYCNNRKEVCLGDCLLLAHCVWEEQADKDKIREKIVHAALLGNISKDIQALEGLIKQKNKELKQRQVECFSQSDHSKLKPNLYNFFYYRLSGRDDLCIFQSDYEALTEQEEDGICYPEPSGGRFNLLRLVRIMKSEKSYATLLQKINVKLRKGKNTLFVNGVEYPLLMEIPDENREEVSAFLTSTIDMEVCHNKCDELVTKLKGWMQTADITEHLFLSASDKQEIQRRLKKLNQQLDNCIKNIEKINNPLHEL